MAFIYKYYDDPETETRQDVYNVPAPKPPQQPPAAPSPQTK